MPEPVLEIHPDVENHDLVEIASYIAKDDPDAAAVVLDEIERTFHLVASFPEAGTLYHPARKSLSDIRMMPVTAYPNYLVFYNAIQDGDGVRILHVLHAARDIATIVRKNPRQ
jgi:plasmid stabilization system protein ParE